MTKQMQNLPRTDRALVRGLATVKKDKNILWFRDIAISDIPLVGGKNASLGEMYSNLTKKGVAVPNGFALTARAYRTWMEQAGLKKKIKWMLTGLDVTDVRQLAERGKKVRELILGATFPKEIEKEILEAYHQLHPVPSTSLAGARSAQGKSVAVRSSATAEDLPDASFAGQQETYLNVKGDAELLLAVKKCVASLYTNRAISYRETKGFDHLAVALSVGVQEMVRSDMGSSGVLFTLDTESGFRGVVLINASYGLGEYVVKGRITPDQFYVFKEGARQGKKAIISRILGTKEVQLVYGKKQGTRQVVVPEKRRNAFAITNDDVLQLAKWGMMIEEYYEKPQDIEWAKDGETGKLYIVQARPETVKTRSNHAVIEKYILKNKSKVRLRGTAVGQKIGAGHVRVIDSPKQMKEFKPGEILVTRLTDPDWEPIMRIAAAIVTEQGGKTSHAAIVSRELGVPCIVGAAQARKILQTGEAVTVSCAEGDEGFIYQGIQPFELHKTEIKDIPKTKTKIMMNVGDPDNAFALSFLPNDGVGLAREEFIFTNFIRIHPLALVHYDKLQDPKTKKQIAEMTRGYKKKTDYCVDKLAEGISRIAVGMYPNPVIIRLSDFKTNEYATLIGGKEFEPKEANPMLGWRGASRYYSKEYKAGFQLECEAIKKVRNDWGLKNIVVMVPFCRTPEEGEKVIETMKEFGLKRGENGLQVYVMCEIPSNVILAADFAKIFDGFSIGSNDLTQLTLGVDRDSALVSHVYNEKNEAVKTLIRDVIRVAHKHSRKVGICGQAPSDHPEFAEFLVKEGIDSISLNPDTVVATKRRIAAAEKTLGKTPAHKTNKKYLSFVGAVGMLAAVVIGLGAGCADTLQGAQSRETVTAQGPTPAMVRILAEEKAKKAEAEAAAQTSQLSVSTFANFSLRYPASWSITQKTQEVRIENPKTGEYILISKQPRKHAPKDATDISVDVLSGKQYQTDGADVVEISSARGGYLVIEGQTGRFDDVLNSVEFTPTGG